MSLAARLPAPTADARFVIDVISSADVQYWYHVYSTHPHANTATTFAQGWGDTRFAPLRHADGALVATFYAASNIDCALNESVLHDVPCDGQFNLARLADYRLVTIALRADLRVVSFHSHHLALLGLTRRQLIDSPPAHYRHTRAWAEAAFQRNPTAQGVAYGSRLNDTGRCVMLFGPRLPAAPFTVIDDAPVALGVLRQAIQRLTDSQRIAYL